MEGRVRSQHIQSLALLALAKNIKAMCSLSTLRAGPMRSELARQVLAAVPHLNRPVQLNGQPSTVASRKSSSVLSAQ